MAILTFEQLRARCWLYKLLMDHKRLKYYEFLAAWYGL